MTNKKCKSKGFNAEGAVEERAEVAEENVAEENGGGGCWNGWKTID
jgi:hypothetical protein